jgi:putative transposase
VGKKTGPNPTDRAKGGTKRSLLTEAAGVPIGLAIAGANRNDFKLFAETVRSVPVRRPHPRLSRAQGMCLDKGYDYDEVRTLARTFGFTLHLRTRGEEARAIKRRAPSLPMRVRQSGGHSLL